MQKTSHKRQHAAKKPAPVPAPGARPLSAAEHLSAARGALDDLVAVAIDACEPVGMQAYDDHLGAIRRHVIAVQQSIRAAELAIGVGA